MHTHERAAGFGVIAFLNTRQKNLTYPSFSLDGLRILPVPCPGAVDTAALADAWDQHTDNDLQPLPQMHSDPVLKAVPGLSSSDAVRWRRSIAQEPSVSNEKDPFNLN